MRSKKDIIKSRFGKKFLSSYVIALMLLSCFVGMMPIVSADGPTDVITTYIFDGSLSASSQFDNGDAVIVNASMDNITGDPPSGPPNFLIAKNNNTDEWVRFPASDNDSGVWGSNPDGDGNYWGFFNVSNTSSVNASQDVIANLNVSNGHTVYIYEDASGLWDNDSSVASKEISIVFSGGSNNPPYAPSAPSPANGSTGVSIGVVLNWTGGDPDGGDTVTYVVYFGATGSPPLASNNQSGTTYDPPGDLSPNTSYYWIIVAWDDHGA